MGITLAWRDSPQKLDIVVDDVTNLRCPAYGVNGKGSLLIHFLINRLQAYNKKGKGVGLARLARGFHGNFDQGHKKISSYLFLFFFFFQIPCADF